MMSTTVNNIETGSSALRKLADLKSTTELGSHQKRVVHRMKHQSGLVVAHGLGSGKTLTSIAVADKLGLSADVVVPAALRANYAKEIKKHVKGGKMPSRIRSMQNMAVKGEVPDRQMLIMDEAHRMRNPQTGIAKSMMASKATKRLALTGTPVYNHPYDIVPLVNFAAGAEALPNDRKKFEERYIETEYIPPGLFGYFLGAKGTKRQKLKNTTELRTVLDKWVDFEEHPTENFPHRIDKVRTVTMSPEQNQIYDGLLGKAPAWVRYKVKRGLPPSKQESKNLNAFLSAARQASTTVEPFSKDSGPTPKLQSAFFSLKNSLNKNKRHKAIVFSNYLEGGLKPYAAMLDAAEIPYGMYTGEQPRKYRDALIEQYNQGKVPVLLLSSAGGEGIDLKGTRQVQILEPHWNEEKLEQAVGRAIRFKSHAHLPKDERNVVVEKYISLPRQGFLGKMFGLKKDQGTDEYLIGLAAGKKTLNDQLLDLLRQKDHSSLQAPE